jgi:hypothetical protein
MARCQTAIGTQTPKHLGTISAVRSIGLAAFLNGLCGTSETEGDAVTIELLVRVEQIQNGAAAVAMQLPLAGHGRDPDRAVASLMRGVLAWCHGLEATGALEGALGDRGMRWRPGDGELTVVPAFL